MTMKIDEELGGGDAPLLNQVIVLSDGRRLDGRLGLDGLAGASLGPRAKLAFMASNLPYVATALWIWWAGQRDPIPSQAGACLGCSSASFHAAVGALGLGLGLGNPNSTCYQSLNLTPTPTQP